MPEVLVLQATPFFGALFGSVGREWFALDRVSLLLAGSVALTAHVFVFNDWAGRSSDVSDPRRAPRVFGHRGIRSRDVAGLAVALLIAATLILSVVGASTALIGSAIAALSFLYSGSSSWGKGRPIVASLIHVIGGAFHFLLGYTISHAVDARGVAIGIFFGLVFAGGHLNQEVRDYDGDLRNGIRTNAVAFGRRRTFLLSLLVFTAAYAMLAFLVALGILPRPLVWGVLLWPWHVACSLRALRSGLGFEAALWMQRQYRLLFALLGFAMVLTTPPVAGFARRAYELGRVLRLRDRGSKFEPVTQCDPKLRWSARFRGQIESVPAACTKNYS
jgi:4-hydroxybenzoate polyprenyltransferase